MTASGERIHGARLESTARITPGDSGEEVRHLDFLNEAPGFACAVGHNIRIRVPIPDGTGVHERYYSIAGIEPSLGAFGGFSLSVRRCQALDAYGGEPRPGIASNFLCDLRPGDRIDFVGPFGLAFPVPADRSSSILMISMGTGIAPFRAYVRHLYEVLGGWDGRVRLFFGARTGLETLYMNLENDDLALYYDRPTFRAFSAICARPDDGVPAALGDAIRGHAAEVWDMLEASGTQVLVAGREAMLPLLDRTLASIAESEHDWARRKNQLLGSGRWLQLTY